MEVCRVKRTIAVAIILALVLSLALPAAAFAKRGGVPAKGSGRGHTPAIVSGEDGETGEGGAVDPGPGKGKGKSQTVDEDVSGDPGDEGTAVDPVEPSQEASRGVANALSRIERNVERRLAAGKAAPAGLLAVIAKFRMWLGLDDGTEPDPGTEPQPGTEDPDPGAEDPVPGDEEPEPDPDLEWPGPDVEPLWAPMR
jgi:hypothetical protein